jgi:uncharacterized repeat protein (TIGR01451 family)
MISPLNERASNALRRPHLPILRWMVLMSVPLLLISLLSVTMQKGSIARAAAPDIFAGCSGAGQTPNFATIQDAVNSAVSGAVINICPGSYPESVNLSEMESIGDITLRRTPGTVGNVLVNPLIGSGIWISPEIFAGNITIESLNITAVDGFGIDFAAEYFDGTSYSSPFVVGNVTISDVNALNNNEDGAYIALFGNALVVRSSFSNNDYYGLYIENLGDSSVDVINTIANNNGYGVVPGDEGTGITVVPGYGVTACNSAAAETAPLHVHVAGVEANGNNGWGLFVDSYLDVLITNTQVISNAYDGVTAFVRYDACGRTIADIELTNSLAEGNGWYSDFKLESSANKGRLKIASHNSPYGGFRLVNDGDGKILVNSSVAEENHQFGYCIYHYTNSAQVQDSRADNNRSEGFIYSPVCGWYLKPLSVGESTGAEAIVRTSEYIEPSLVITDSTAISNVGVGFALVNDSLAITVANISSLKNDAGIAFLIDDYYYAPGGASVRSSNVTDSAVPSEYPIFVYDSLIISNTEYGIIYEQPVSAPLVGNQSIDAAAVFTSPSEIHSNIICENGIGLGAYQYQDERLNINAQASDEFLLSIDARGNWWGDITGPYNDPDNPDGLGNSVESEAYTPVAPSVAANAVEVLFDPWIDTLYASAVPSPTIVGVPVALAYRFSAELLGYYLQNGVGDPNNGPLFSLAATNGSIDGGADKSIVNTLINGSASPSAPGPMTVRLNGPCGLSPELVIPVASPAIGISKSPDLQGVAAGDSAFFTVTVTNLGDITLTDVAVSDPIAPSCSRATGALGDLAVGDSATYSCSHTVNNNLINTISAQGFALVSGAAAGNPVTASDTAEVLVASFTLTKTIFVDGYREFVGGEFHPSDCALSSNIKVPVNATVKYCYTITNTGDYTLTKHSLVDSHFPDPILADFPRELGPNQSFSTVDAGVDVTQTLTVSTTNVATWTATLAGPIVEVEATAVDAVLSVAANASATATISSADDDQDEDGIPDNIEGTGDVDADGIPDYLDPQAPTSLPEDEQPDAFDDDIFLPSVVR